MTKKQSFITYIKEDFRNLNLLIKENLFGLLTIIFFTIAGYTIGYYFENNEATTSNVEISFISDEDISSQARNNAFKTTLNSFYDIPNDLSYKTSIVLPNNALQSNIFSKFFDNFIANSFVKIFNSSIKNEKELKKFLFSPDEINFIKNLEINRLDIKLDNITTQGHYKIFSPNINKISNNEFYEKFLVMIKKNVLINFQKSADTLYNERVNILLSYISQLDSMKKNFYEEGLVQKENTLILLNQQIDIASSLGISGTHVSIENYQPVCNLKKIESLISLGQCFLYGKEFLELERKFIKSLDITAFNKNYFNISKTLDKLKNITEKNYLEASKLKINSIIFDYQDLLFPNLKIEEIKTKNNTMFNKQFMASLFFIFASFIIFFFTVIKNQRKNT